MAQFKVEVDDELQKKFKATLAMRSETAKEVVVRMMEEYIEGKVKVQSEVPGQSKSSQSTVESAKKLSWVVDDKVPQEVADDEERESNSFLHGDTKVSNSNDPDVWLKQLFGE